MISLENDITRALRSKLTRLQTERKLAPYPPHEFTMLDLKIDNVVSSLRRAEQWSLYRLVTRIGLVVDEEKLYQPSRNTNNGGNDRQDL